MARILYDSERAKDDTKKAAELNTFRDELNKIPDAPGYRVEYNDMLELMEVIEVNVTRKYPITSVADFNVKKEDDRS